MEYWMRKVGCRPTHWKFHHMKGLPVCLNASQMKAFSEQPQTSDIEAFVPPCKHIDQLDYIYRELDLDENG